MSSLWGPLQSFALTDVLARYEQFVKTHKPAVDLFEHLSHFFILLFLEREDREWETELAYSSLHLLNYYHGSILKPSKLSSAETQWIQNQIQREEKAASSVSPALDRSATLAGNDDDDGGDASDDDDDDDDDGNYDENNNDVGNHGKRTQADDRDNPTFYWNDPFEPDRRHYRLVNETLNRTMSKWLQLLSYVEVITEMTAERFDHSPQKSRKWGIVLLIEIFKCICKLRLLMHTGGRIHVDHQRLQSSYRGFEKFSTEMRRRQRMVRKHFQNRYLFSENAKSKVVSPSLQQESSAPASSSDHRIGRRSGRTIPDPSFVFQFIAVRQRSRKYRADTHVIIGEILNAVRPVIYVLCLVKWRKWSWSPWLISLFIDLLSRALVGDMSMRTKAEKDEIARRTHNWLHYLFRSPFFDQFLKPFALVVCRKLSRIPILSSLVVNILEYMIALQAYYFYTASS